MSHVPRTKKLMLKTLKKPTSLWRGLENSAAENRLRSITMKVHVVAASITQITMFIIARVLAHM